MEFSESVHRKFAKKDPILLQILFTYKRSKCEKNVNMLKHVLCLSCKFVFCWEITKVSISSTTKFKLFIWTILAIIVTITKKRVWNTVPSKWSITKWRTRKLWWFTLIFNLAFGSMILFKWILFTITKP